LHGGILRKFADSSKGSEKIKKAVGLAEHFVTFPMEVFLSTIVCDHLLNGHHVDHQKGLILTLSVPAC
jgi:hypothetical protein